MDKEAILAGFIEKIDQELERLVPSASCSYRSLYEGARYSLLGGGKRVRPLLTLAVNQMLGGKLEQALVPACALEMIHTYSLIHDDLPCMDDDDFRRGKPSLHKVYTEGHAVLVGDFLLTYAFQTLATSFLLSSSQKVCLIATLTRAAGGEGMIGGQVLDLAQDPSISIEELHQRKTGALFTASVECGGIVASCSSEIQQDLRMFGQQIGYLFQVVDDVLDSEHGLTVADAEKAAHLANMSLKNLPGNKWLLEHILQKILSPIMDKTH